MKFDVGSLISIIILFTLPSSFAAPAQNPEVKKTAEVMLGTWAGTMTAKVGAEDPESFTNIIKCKKIALGAGTECTSTAKASIGTLAQTCLLAYDPESKSVHQMCVTSMGEVHDHKGKWVDENTIEFEPYVGAMSGEKITEHVKISFPTESSIKTSSIITTASGMTMTFEFEGARKKK